MGATCSFAKGKGWPVTTHHTVRSAASITPPVLAKMSAAPELRPRGWSIGSSRSARKSIPAWVIMRPNSRVVSTASTSCTPLAFISGRWASNFFAVHGITATTTMSPGFRPIFWA